MNPRLVVALCAVLVAGCGSGSSGSTGSPAAGRAFVVGGDRPVTVQVPTSYDPGTPAPLLIVLHGFGSSGRNHETYFHLGDAAERRGMISAYPDGTADSSDRQFWNATDACCDVDGSGVDDSRYLASVVSAIKAHVAVDAKRVYLMGHSNGGFMSYRMACDHADVVAAIVSLAAATSAHDDECHPSAGVSVLEIHGTADEVVSFDGGNNSGLGNYPGARETVTKWAEYDECDPVASKSRTRVDVDADLEFAGDRAETTVETWAGCRHRAAVELWTMQGGIHAPAISDAFPDAVLDFLLAHPKQ